MLRKKGINCDCIKDAKQTDTLELIKRAGFDSYFTNSYKADEVQEIVEKGNALGLECEFLHAPFVGINAMWLDGDEYKGIYEKMKETICSASLASVKKVIVHLSSGWAVPNINDLGQKRFDELISYAKEKSVVLVFENLRAVGNVAYFVDKYKNESAVRFCYDCGHEHCYTKFVCWLDIFRDKLVATHIHDNFGRKEEGEENTDLHLLPFDGNIDYEKMMQKLDEYNYGGSLMLEVFNSARADYGEMSAQEFIRTCYERISKISRLND